MYEHRKSNLGDFVAMHFYEDLFTVARSDKYTFRVTAQSRVLNVENRRVGISARRGDGTFGEIIPGQPALVDPGYAVARGPVATVEIGIEVKILAKAMIKQIGRVTSDLREQVREFKHRSGDYEPLCIGIVGVNHATVVTSVEGERTFTTDGRKHKHPYQEAPEAQARLLASAAPAYDEFMLLPYRATNQPPFAFEWVDSRATEQEYGAILTRIARSYEKRF